MGALAARFEEVFSRLHRPESIEPDPLEEVRRFPDPSDREIAGLIAATLAFGRVPHILRSVECVLGLMGPHPSKWLAAHTRDEMHEQFADWRHRWATGEELCELLLAVRGVRQVCGSLAEAWRASIRIEDRDAHDTLVRWVARLDEHGLSKDNSLMPRPERPSACKRLHLYLRWMIRCDAVDPGGWPDAPSRLIVPLDVHMHRITRALGLTRRRAADLRAAREITARFRQIDPADPVRFDFSLTRLPIHEGLSMREIRRLLSV